MMSFLLGKRHCDLIGESATLSGYSLTIQHLDHTPDSELTDDTGTFSVRSLLQKSWGKNFKNYVIKADPTGWVGGVVWKISPLDLEIIRYWELVDLGWYDEGEVMVKTRTGQNLIVKTVFLREGHLTGSTIDPVAYEHWLQPPVKYKQIARESRIRLLDSEVRVTDKHPLGLASPHSLQ